MDVDRCLERIKYTGPVTPDVINLRALQLAFLLEVPFENLDIHLGRKIKLDPADIFEKIVINKRGGVCYENNILFCQLLVALGYRAEYLSARMVRGQAVGPEYDHMVLLVTLEHDYIVDVGSGLSPREPLRLDGRNTAKSEGCFYRVARHDRNYALHWRRSEPDWAIRFIFSGKPHLCSEFEEMNRHHQSCESFSTRRPLATIATPGGRITLAGRRLIIRDGPAKVEKELGSGKEYLDSLKHYFGITISASYAPGGRGSFAG